MNTHADTCFAVFKPRLRTLLLGIVLAVAASTAVSEDQIDDQLAGLEQAIAYYDSQVADFDKRIEICDGRRYDRQGQWWRLRRQIEIDVREFAQLRRQILEAKKAGREAPEETQRRVAELETRTATNLHFGKGGEARTQANATWDKVGRLTHAMDGPYGWHLVKLNLLRDLIHRARRTRFYLQEAMRAKEDGHGATELPKDEAARRLAALRVDGGSEPIKLGYMPSYDGSRRDPRMGDPLYHELDNLVRDSRTFADEYGELFFGVREQRALGQFDEADALAERAARLAPALAVLEERREQLTGKVLAYLARFDKDGKFKSLGVPERGEITFDADGRPSTIVVCGSNYHSTPLEPLEDRLQPLCFDVLDFQFGGMNPKPEVLEDENGSVQRRVANLRADLDKGYYIKQPLEVFSHWGPSAPVDVNQIDPNDPNPA